MAALTPLFREHFRALHSELPVSLAYTSDPDVARADDEEAVRDRLHAGLAARRGLDERRRFTGFGPHTDDLDIGLAGAPARSHASQGQLRSLVLALKLAELSNVEARLGDPPVLLLDDVPSELDPVRRALLFDVIGASRLPDAHLGHRTRHRSRAAGAARFSGTRRERRRESVISCLYSPRKCCYIIETVQVCSQRARLKHAERFPCSALRLIYRK